MTILTSNHLSDSDWSNYDKTDFGSKVKGLNSLPEAWTPPYVVIPSEYFTKWVNNCKPKEDSFDNILPINEIKTKVDSILEVWDNIEKDKGRQIDNLGEDNEIIIRSSGLFDDSLGSRGEYISHVSSQDITDIINGIWKVWKYAHEHLESSPDEISFGIVIQPRVAPYKKGHLSNERRVSRNYTNWSIEWEKGRIDNKSGNNRFSTLQINQPYDESDRIVATSRNIVAKRLKEIAASSGDPDKRVHYEWVWNGSNIWIVQKDIQNIQTGAGPGNEWKYDYPDDSDFSFNVLKNALDSDKSWKKTECLEVFEECGLFHPDLFILEGDLLQKYIENDSINPTLKQDIQKIVEAPVVIRTDILKNERENVEVFSPRSDALVDVGDVISFICETNSKFKDHDYNPSEFCFLIHHYMVSKSSALAQASPNNPKVSVDSTWGIPDGLNYYPHDSFRVDIDDEEVDYQDKRCKGRYIDVSNDGSFIEKKAGKPWDWKTSISDENLFSIARKARTIADYVDETVIVMFFVDLDIDKLSGESIPWFFWEGKESKDESSSLTKNWSSSDVLVKCEKDLDYLKAQNLETLNKSDPVIRFNPTPEYVRDIDFVEDLGSFAENQEIPIHLEGSVLSHVYYILQRSGAKVLTTSSNRPSGHSRHFSKLVRDNIPIQIESGGEETRTYDVPSGDLVDLLKSKAVEEALEFSQTENGEDEVEELADLYEIIHSYSEVRGIPLDEILDMAHEKREKKGGFTEGIVLVSTLDENFSAGQDKRSFEDRRPRLPTPLVPHEKVQEDALPKELRRDESGSAIEAPLIPPTIRGLNETTQFNFPEIDVRLQLTYANDKLILLLKEDEDQTPKEDQANLSDF